MNAVRRLGRQPRKLRLKTPARLCRNYYTMAKRKPIPTITDTLRKAILDSGMNFKALERETGVTRQSLMKFAKGESSLRLDLADKLAAHFGLTVNASPFEIKPSLRQIVCMHE